MSLLKDKIEVEIEEVELNAEKAFSGFPSWFKWFLIVWIIAIIPVYLISKNISKNIWLKRYQQNELLAKTSFTEPKNPTISNITLTTFKTGTYAAVLQITNPNFELSLDRVPYQILFFNSQGQQIYSYSDNLYLLPNQTKYLTVPTFAPSETISSANIQLPPNLPWQKRLQIPEVSLLTSPAQTSLQTSPPAFIVSGNFTNNSPYTLGDVRLTFLLFDAGNNIIGVSQRDEFSVRPYERRAYNQLWPNLFPGNVSKVEVDAYTNTLDPNNLQLAASANVATSTASDLSRP